MRAVPKKVLSQTKSEKLPAHESLAAINVKGSPSFARASRLTQAAEDGV